MKRETRANIIFLLLLLAITLPGAVILFQKKLDPAAPPMFMPDFVRRRLPYMAPQLTPEQVTRFVPDLAGEWVERVNREKRAGAKVLMHGHLPLISDDRKVQLVSMTEKGSETMLYLLIWDPDWGSEPRHYTVSADSSGPALIGRVQAVESVTVPEPVRRELMYGGFVKPPAHVQWVSAKLDVATPQTPPLTLRVRYREGGAETKSTVNVFTNGELDAN